MEDLDKFGSHTRCQWARPLREMMPVASLYRSINRKKTDGCVWLIQEPASSEDNHLVLETNTFGWWFTARSLGPLQTVIENTAISCQGYIQPIWRVDRGSLNVVAGQWLWIWCLFGLGCLLHLRSVCLFTCAWTAPCSNDRIIRAYSRHWIKFYHFPSLQVSWYKNHSEIYPSREHERCWVAEVATYFDVKRSH